MYGFILWFVDLVNEVTVAASDVDILDSRRFINGLIYFFLGL